MGIDVAGGAGGFDVALEELTGAAQRLSDWAEEVARVAASVVAVAVDPALLGTAPLSPVTAARVEAELIRAGGPLGLAGDAAALAGLAAATRSAVLAYRGGEAAVRAGVEAGQDTAMLTAGALAVPLGLLALRARAGGVDLGATADIAAFRAPWLADLAGGVEGLGVGPALNPSTGLVLGCAGIRSEALGSPTYERALGTTTALGSRFGLLRDGAQVAVRRERRPGRGATPPRDLATLVRDLDVLSDGASYPSRVRVVEVPQPDGTAAWIVEVPGTQVWSPRAGANAFDVTTDLHVMAQHRSTAALGVERALSAARREAHQRTGRDTSGEPVLLAGHSLGGIIAARMAADPGFRQRQHVTHVVTSGSPVARMPIPDTISVLSLEHRQDPVPRLEGRANPAGARWVTVTRDLSGDPVAAGRASAAHGAGLYAVTAAQADRSNARSLADWRQGSAGFFTRTDGAAPIIRDYRVERFGSTP